MGEKHPAHIFVFFFRVPCVYSVKCFLCFLVGTILKAKPINLGAFAVVHTTRGDVKFVLPAAMKSSIVGIVTMTQRYALS